MVMGELTQETELLVIGAGPGGYTAAFRAADLGLDVTMLDLGPRPGGACLYRGCIPSKALLFATELIHDAKVAAGMGITFCEPRIEPRRLREWKDQVVGQLASGLAALGEKRNVQIIQARASFESSGSVRLVGSEIARFRYKHAILATGSSPIPLPDTEFRPGGRVMDSTGALALEEIPSSLLVVGGGYIGLEMGSVYASLGSRVTLVERGDRLLPGSDRDLARPLARRVGELFDSIWLNSWVESISEREDGVDVVLGGAVKDPPTSFDRVLVAIGRRANTQGIGLEHTRVRLDDRGFVMVDDRQRTTDEKILAIGDVAGGAMLAHKAMREGKVAAEVIAGEPSTFDIRAIPAVVYTDPQVAWCGLTEEQAAVEGRPIKVGRFPWSASGRAASMGVSEGLTKVIFDPESQRVLGVGIVGRGAGEMIAEGVLAVEMGALAQDLALTMHPHPTLSETQGEAADAFLGSAIHLLPGRR